METQPVRIRGIGKGGASRYGKPKNKSGTLVGKDSPKKKGKSSPRKSRSLKTLEKMVERTPSRSPNRTRSASRSSSGSIEIDRAEIERAKRKIKEANAERKKYDIPKEYQNYPIEDIPLQYLKLKKSSPAKKAERQSPKKKAERQSPKKKIKTMSPKKSTKILKALDKLKNNENITIFKIIKGKEGVDIGSKLLLAGDELYDYFEDYSDQEKNDAVLVLVSQKYRVKDNFKEKVGAIVFIGDGKKFSKNQQFFSKKQAMEWWSDYPFWK